MSRLGGAANIYFRVLPAPLGLGSFTNPVALTLEPGQNVGPDSQSLSYVAEPARRSTYHSEESVAPAVLGYNRHRRTAQLLHDHKGGFPIELQVAEILLLVLCHNLILG
jgi:hypothetical protein